MKTDSHPPMPASDHEAIEATAAVWLSLRDRGLDEAETAEFMRWLQRDPRHAEVFNALDRTWRDFNRIGAARPAGAAEPDLLVPRPRKRRLHPAAWSTLAAAAAVALAWVGFHFVTAGRPTAETAIGAYQRLDLPDGSVVQLNTDSAVEVKYTETERRVRLVRGEAHFTVAKNPARPFVVGAAGVAVRAVGTAFNVRLRTEKVEVLVTEGRVQVDDAARGVSLLGPAPAGQPALLEKGEKAVVPASPATPAEQPETAPVVVTGVDPAEVERALAWQERRLMFEGTPLGEAVEEFNRHNTHKLVLSDPRLAGRRFGGTFRADGYEAFVALLEANFGVEAERQEDRTLLRAAR